ncbi:MAG: hypothetical protein ACP5QT_00860 [Brevinematia bacterium]
MKRGYYILISLVLGGLILSCGRKPNPVAVPEPSSGTSEAPLIKIHVIQKSTDPTPYWVNKKWEIGKDELGRKVIFLTVEGQRNTKEKAEIEAESRKIARLSELIKQVATREFAIAKQGMLNDETELDTYFEETIAAVSKNVNISGAMNVEDYWEYIQEVQGDSSRTYWRYVKRYAMDYETYQKAVKQAWEPVAKKIPPDLKNRAEKVLENLNKSQEPLSE